MSSLPLLLIASILIFSDIRASARDIDYCFADEDDPYLYMATKTAYHFVHGGKTRFQAIPYCRPMQMWMLATHGTRCPSLHEIDKIYTLTNLRDQILSNHEQRRDGRLCNRDLDNLRRWETNEYLSRQRAESLTPQGVEDMKLLARRLQTNFPELLLPESNDITSDNYKFRTTDASNSMNFFMEGLFGSIRVHMIRPEASSVNDTLLSPYKTCHVWKNDENEQSFESTERKAFDSTVEFQNLKKNVSRRLGFLYDISIDTIDAMYDACRYEKAWTVTKLSPWCAVFNKEELRILEYREDLEYYHKAGYGREINARLGCPLLQNMMQHFWNLVNENGPNEPKGIFHFSDIISLQNLLTTMGINEDSTHLTAYNYKDTAKRQWRTSLISSFAANFVAVLYKCENSRDKNKVMFYLGEKPVQYDGCQVGLCDWEFLTSKFGKLMADCKLDICWERNGVSSNFSLPLNSIVISFLCFILAFRAHRVGYW